MPFSTSLVEEQRVGWLQYGGVQLATLVSLGLVDEPTALLIEREPRDVHRTVSHRQHEFTVPDTRAVGEDFDVVDITTTRVFLRTSQRVAHTVHSHCYS